MGKTFERSSFLLFHSMNSSTDRIVALYLITTGALILIFRESLSTFRLIAALHLVGAAATAYLRYIRRTRMPGSVGFVHDWYPVMLIPVLYKEVEFLAEAFGNWGLTGRLQRIESTLFGGQPSLCLLSGFRFGRECPTSLSAGKLDQSKKSVLQPGRRPRRIVRA